MIERPTLPDNCPRCDKELILVEYGWPSNEMYDGISEHACPDQKCGYRIGRWTGKEIAPGFIESRYGAKGHVPYNPTKPLWSNKDEETL